MIEKRDFYINGQWVAPSQPNDFEVINPSTEEVCATISLGGQADGLIALHDRLDDVRRKKCEIDDLEDKPGRG